MRRDILGAAKSARKSFAQVAPKGEKIIYINWVLPYVSINGIDNEYFFQGQEASDLLAEATDTANKFQVSIEDVLIWQSQSW